jgi:GNAT superfamily N-acetyltransferase
MPAFECDGLHYEVTDRPDAVLDAFYPAFDRAFVLDSEKERKDGFVDCLELNAGPMHQALQERYGPFRELILIAREAPGAAVVGGANFLVVGLPPEGDAPARHTVNLNYLFVDPRQRGRGLSRRILQVCSALSAGLAESWHGVAPAADGLVFLELNDPLRLTPEAYRLDSEHAGIDQVARLAYWTRAGAAVLDLDYVQPALSAEQKDDDTLALAVIGSHDKALPARLVHRHLERFFAISVLKGAPLDSSPSAARQLQALRDTAKGGRPVNLLKLGDGLPRVARQVSESPADRCGSLPQALAEDGVAFFTLSMLMTGAQINALIAASGGPGEIWNQDLLKHIENKPAESRELQKAIKPMFDDIADRERNLFIKDFLLDTPNHVLGAAPPRPPGIDPKRDTHWRNVCADVELTLGPAIRWETEGMPSALDLDAPIRFAHVLCRAFWMVHSNDSLSFHLSFEVPYRHGLSGYYGLSMLQKAFYPTEGTEWVVADQGWKVARPGAAPVTLLAFIEELFERNAEQLFAKLDSIDATVAKAIGARAWQRLVLDDPYASDRQVTRAEAWRHSPSRRALVVLRDRRVFDAIERARREPDLLRELEPMKAPLGHYDSKLLAAHFKAHAGTLATPSDGQAIDGDELMLTVFLSGFLQNIVDFLEQDGLEVHDGLSPLYPPSDSESSNEGYFVYATPKAVFEVVSTSRSLDRAGRTWLGTCPYMFLVHITAFHNEAIVRAYEVRVTELIEKLKNLISDRKPGRKVDPAEVTRAYEEIKEFRLKTFEQVHKHLSFNIFRYETERSFFASVADVRGIDGRQSYWDGVLQHLTETVDSLKDDRAARYGLRLAWLGFVLTLLGFLQLWFALFPLVVDDKSPPPFPLHGMHSAAAGGVVTLLLIAVFLLYTRRWFK